MGSKKKKNFTYVNHLKLNVKALETALEREIGGSAWQDYWELCYAISVCSKQLRKNGHCWEVILFQGTRVESYFYTMQCSHYSA